MNGATAHERRLLKVAYDTNNYPLKIVLIEQVQQRAVGRLG